MHNVEHPEHYSKSSLECIDVMRLMYGELATVHFCLCNAFKYLWRYKNKNGMEDLEKAEFYLNYMEKNLIQFYKDTEIQTQVHRLENTINRIIMEGVDDYFKNNTSEDLDDES